MERLTDKKQIRFLLVLSMLSYFGSYLTRVNLTSIIEELKHTTSLTANDLALAGTCNVIAYGVGMVICGFLINKAQPKLFLSLSLFIAAAMNIVIPFYENFGGKTAVIIAWGINGFGQALMWPALIKVLLNFLSAPDYDKGIFWVSLGSSAGSILTYASAPVMFKIFGNFGWKVMFFAPAAVAVIIALIWAKSDFIITNEVSEKAKTEKSNVKVFDIMLFGIIFAIILQGVMRDGVTTWMPTYINDNFNLGTGISILSGVILPLFSVFSFWIVLLIYHKIKNPVICAALFFTAATVMCFVLKLLNTNVFAAMLSMAVIVGCMHGVNTMLISMVPKYYANMGCGATLSGVLNAFTYVGSAVSVYGVVAFSSRFGWGAAVYLWAGICFTGIAVLFAVLKTWNIKFGRKAL